MPGKGLIRSYHPTHFSDSDAPASGHKGSWNNAPQEASGKSGPAEREAVSAREPR